jgi:hypothetical protein
VPSVGLDWVGPCLPVRRIGSDFQVRLGFLGCVLFFGFGLDFFGLDRGLGKNMACGLCVISELLR